MRNKIRRRSYINAHFGRRDVFENFPQKWMQEAILKKCKFLPHGAFPQHNRHIFSGQMKYFAFPKSAIEHGFEKLESTKPCRVFDSSTIISIAYIPPMSLTKVPTPIVYHTALDVQFSLLLQISCLGPFILINAKWLNLNATSIWQKNVTILFNKKLLKCYTLLLASLFTT